MLPKVKSFLNSEAGGISVDWVVLTAVLLGTGLSVLSNMEQGVEFASLDVSSELRGQAVRSSFEGSNCQGGISGLQALENARVAENGGSAVNVTGWLTGRSAGLDDDALRREHRQMANALPKGDTWTRQRTFVTALECEMAQRGLD